MDISSKQFICNKCEEFKKGKCKTLCYSCYLEILRSTLGECPLKKW